jgi:hypothetical protein
MKEGHYDKGCGRKGAMSNIRAFKAFCRQGQHDEI